jgi:hypothetical protein
MTTPWKKIGEVAIEIAAATVVILTTVFVERCIRTVAEEGAGSAVESDRDEEPSKLDESESTTNARFSK